MVRLLSFAPPTDGHLVAQLDCARVVSMNDGGMGSLKFCSNQPDRRFGREIARGDAQGSDGVWLSIALNLDATGALFELDIFKGDFSPIQKMPAPEKMLPSGR